MNRPDEDRAPLHIAHGVLSLDVGGLERLVVSLIGAAARRGHHVSVVCIERPGKLAAEAEAAGARVVSLDKPAGRLPEYVERAAEILAALKPDVVHTHQIGAAWYLGPAAKRQGRPVIHTEHGNHFVLAPDWRQRLKLRLLARAAARSIDRFCCVSEEIARAATRWRTVPQAKVEVIANGIPATLPEGLPQPQAVRESLGIPAAAPVIGTVGRLSEVKQQDMLIRAARRLSDRWPELRVVIVGDGPERARLETVTREAGMSDRVLFLGYQSCPEQFLNILDVFALTSRTEGFPVSLLEAWRAARPVVATAVGGIPAVVAEGESGLLVPAGDEAAVASAIGRVLESPDFAARLGRAGQETLIKRYSLERMAAEYERRYRELRSHAGTPGPCAYSS
jgi:glycosyltransferase involved in cell wall biosynthesis